MKEKKIRRIPLWAVLVPLLIALASIPVWFSGLPQYTERHDDKESPVPVRILTPETRDMAVRINFHGVLESRRKAVLTSAASGTIVMIAETGTAFREGEQLALIDPEPYAAAYRQARAGLNAAETARNRSRINYEAGAISRQVLDQAETAYETALGHYENARIALSRTRTSAPFDGTVTRRFANPHEAAGPGTPLLIFETTGELTVTSEIPERHGGRFFSPGEDISVIIRSPRENGAILPVKASILRIDPTVKPETRTFTVICLLSGSLLSGSHSGNREAQLVPGMLVRGEFLTGIRRSVPAVPLSAAATDSRLWYVTLEEGKNRARSFLPEEPFVDEGFIAVPEELGTHQFITDGHYGLREGALVRIVGAGANIGAGDHEPVGAGANIGAGAP